MSLQAQIGAAIIAGYEVVQEGRIVPYTGTGKATFADRAEGFKIGLMGSYPPPSYRSQFDNLLFDDAVRWVHLRRPRRT